MKYQPDFEHPELLVAEIMRRFPRRKLMTLDAIAKRFHERYGKGCSREMVCRGTLALLDKYCPDGSDVKEPPGQTQENAPAE